MKIIRAIFRPIWKVWFLLCFAIPFLVMFPVFYLALRSGNFDLVYRMKRFWARIISTGSLLFPKIRYVKHKHKLPQPCVIVCNHTSYLDIVFSPFYIDHTAAYMGKYELLKAPLFKYFFVYLDIPVNRRSVTGSHKAFLKAGEMLDKGISVVIYPEGTIGKQGRLKEFKNGAFKLAVEKQVPIVPVVNLNNWHFLENGGFLTSHGSPGIPRIVVGETIDTKGMKEEDIAIIRDKVYTFIKHELNTYHGKKD
jgi:1-acyl-sn-glycerol-3-phosphate acyltransferase